MHRDFHMKKVLFLVFVFLSAQVLAEPVNINTADAEIIAESLNGIGVKKAQAIIEYRTVNGDFKTVASLMEVSGIGEKTIENNKDNILLIDVIVPKKVVTKVIKK